MPELKDLSTEDRRKLLGCISGRNNAWKEKNQAKEIPPDVNRRHFSECAQGLGLEGYMSGATDDDLLTFAAARIELPTEDFPDQEIFEAGTWTSTQGMTRRYTVADLERMVANYKALQAEIKIPLRMEHLDDETHQRYVGGPALGWFDNLRVKGTKLLADLKRVPAKVAALIRARTYRRLSADLIPFFQSEGDRARHFRDVIPSVGLLGATLPAITTLKDVYNELFGMPDAEVHILEPASFDDKASNEWADSYASELGSVLSFARATLEPLKEKGGENAMTLEEAIAAIEKLKLRVETLETTSNDDKKSFANIATALGVAPTEDLAEAATTLVNRTKAAEKKTGDDALAFENAQLDEAIAAAKKDGKLLPRDERIARALYLGFKAEAGEQGRLTFSAPTGKEGEEKAEEKQGTPLEALRAHYAAAARVVELGEEKGKTGTGAKKIELPPELKVISEERGWKVDEEREKLAFEARKIADKEGISFERALDRIEHTGILTSEDEADTIDKKEAGV